MIFLLQLQTDNCCIMCDLYITITYRLLLYNVWSLYYKYTQTIAVKYVIFLLQLQKYNCCIMYDISITAIIGYCYKLCDLSFTVTYRNCCKMCDLFPIVTNRLLFSITITLRLLLYNVWPFYYSYIQTTAL